MKEGLEHAYNGEFDASDKYFDDFTKLEPNSPIGYWRKANNRLARIRSDEGAKYEPTITEEKYDEIAAIIDTGIEKAKLKIAHNEDVGFNNYVIASSLGLKAAFQKGAGMSKLTYVPTGQEMMKYARRSDYPDAKFLVALTNLKLDEQPFYIKWALKGLGQYIPPRKESLRMMRQAAENNDGFFVDDIWLVLFVETKDKSSSEAEKLETEKLYEYLTKYPKNEAVLKYAKKHGKPIPPEK
ncbi:MAG: hypothetical protein KGJ89_04860 [Patescibacteria group bacterium]|nr:hypothetical protein [Patescibacteria group bacterium]MDE2227253.1 hypothetical protein [Patescibacteria group bacterium]